MDKKELVELVFFVCCKKGQGKGGKLHFWKIIQNCTTSFKIKWHLRS
jgi:hypothetical protein